MIRTVVTRLGVLRHRQCYFFDAKALPGNKLTIALNRLPAPAPALMRNGIHPDAAHSSLMGVVYLRAFVDDGGFVGVVAHDSVLERQGAAAAVAAWPTSALSASISACRASYSAILRLRNRPVRAAFSEMPAGVSR